jgi:hypothetical protein
LTYAKPELTTPDARCGSSRCRRPRGNRRGGARFRRAGTGMRAQAPSSKPGSSHPAGASPGRGARWKAHPHRGCAPTARRRHGRTKARASIRDCAGWQWDRSAGRACGPRIPGHARPCRMTLSMAGLHRYLSFLAMRVPDALCTNHHVRPCPAARSAI